MTKSSMSYINITLAYAIPAVLGVVITENWGGAIITVVTLIVSFVSFDLNRTEGLISFDDLHKEMNSSNASLLVGIGIAILLYVYANPWLICLMILQFFIQFMVYSRTDEESNQIEY